MLFISVKQGTQFICSATGKTFCLFAWNEVKMQCMIGVLSQSDPVIVAHIMRNSLSYCLTNFTQLHVLYILKVIFLV